MLLSQTVKGLMKPYNVALTSGAHDMRTETRRAYAPSALKALLWLAVAFIFLFSKEAKL